MLSLLQDLRYSARAFLKAPWFAMLAIVTLGLGIAVNTTIFSVVNGFLLRPLPVAHPEQLVVLSLQQGGDHALQNFSYPDYADLREQSGSAFAELAGYRITLRSLTSEKVGDHSLVTRVTGNYFSMLGIQPALGRLILPTEGQVPGADPVIVLGYSYWQKRFAGDKNVLGKHVELGGHPMTIVGVAPKDFHGTYFIVNSDLYVPLSADIADAGDTAVQDTWTQRADRSLTLMGRLKPGTGLKQAEAALNLAAQRIASQHPDTDKAISVRAFAENRARPEPDPDNTLAVLALAFMGLAALVLLVACFNVTNVLLGPGNFPAARDGHSFGFGRGACQTGATISDGEFAARWTWRRARVAAHFLGYAISERHFSGHRFAHSIEFPAGCAGISFRHFRGGAYRNYCWGYSRAARGAAGR